MNTISIVAPVWNGKSLLEKTLPTWVAAMKNSNNKIAEIVLVDDKSTDDTLSYLKMNFRKDIRLICHKKNRGFSATVNTGFRSVKSPLVCLLNQDVEVSPNFLASVTAHFSDPRVFAVSLHEKGYVYAVSKFEDGFIGHGQGKTTNKIHTSFWASGGSAVFSRSIWNKLKGLDESLLSPFYWEDIDLGYRAWKRGYKILWDPDARVIHHHESVINTTSFKKYRLNLIKERNQLIFIWKNLTSANLFRKHIRGLTARVARHPGYIKVVTAALLKIKGILVARRIEKKESIVSDEAIIEMLSH